jgi:hypothetical protein
LEGLDDDDDDDDDVNINRALESTRDNMRISATESLCYCVLWFYNVLEVMG